MEQRICPRGTRLPDQGVTLVDNRGSGITMQVWEDCHPAVRASVTVGNGDPVILVADHAMATIYEREAVTFGVERIVDGVPGWYVLFA